MAIALLAGIGCAVVYNRRRLWVVHGLASPSSPRLFGRQVLLMSLVGSIFLSSMPGIAMAGTPVYNNPIFYYYHPDHLGSAQIMTDATGRMGSHLKY